MEGVYEHFQQEGSLLAFTGRTTFRTELFYNKDFLLDGQTSRSKLSSQPVNLPSAWPLMKTLRFWFPSVYNSSLHFEKNLKEHSVVYLDFSVNDSL